MASFKVLKCITEVTYFEKTQRRDNDGNTYTTNVEKTRTVSPGAYGVENIEVGQVIDIDDPRLADKARANPDFEEVKDKPKKKAA